MGSIDVGGLFSIGLLVISEAVVDVCETLGSILYACREFAECVSVFSISGKAHVPGGIDIFGVWIVCSLGETELELEPAEMRSGTASGRRRNMSLIFLSREVLLPHAAFELVSGEFTVASFRFVVVVGFDLAECPKFCVEVLMKCDECCFCGNQD